jgi:hypothetical protein
MNQLQQNGPLKLGVIGARGVGNVQGGIERYCASFYKELPQNRFHVTIFVSRRACAGDWPAGIDVIYLPVPLVKHFEKVAHSFVSILFALYWASGHYTFTVLDPALVCRSPMCCGCARLFGILVRIMSGQNGVR